VVDGKSKQDKQTADGVGSPAVDSICLLAAYRQLTVVAQRALTPALENGKDRPVKVRSCPAMVAAKQAFGEDFEEHAPMTARHFASAFATTRHRYF
jgi:hypothetical protein